MHAQLQALAELLVQLFVVFLLLGYLCKHLQALFDQILLDHAQHPVMLQSLPKYVQREVLRVCHALDKI